MDKHSPTPWRVVNVNQTYHVDAADGGFVALFVSEANAALIVEAVNGMDAMLKLQRTLLGWSIERDRLRDLVRRFADGVRNYRFAAGPETNALLREAREALGEGEP
jgi:hypothetical protein